MWRWRIDATDDQNRVSTAERPIQVDYTVTALKVPAVAHTLTRQQPPGWTGYARVLLESNEFYYVD